MKIVICHDFGGFIPSAMLCRRFAARKKADLSKESITEETGAATHRPYNPHTLAEAWILDNYNIDSLSFRMDSDLVELVEDEISKGRCEYLQVVDVPEKYKDKVIIDNYDGNEYVSTKYQTWGRGHEFGNDR
jgi:hypothetical protein